MRVSGLLHGAGTVSIGGAEKGAGRGGDVLRGAESAAVGGVVRCDVAAGAGMWCPSVLSGAAPPPPHRSCCTVPNAPQGAPTSGCCFTPQLWQLDLVTPPWGAEKQDQRQQRQEGLAPRSGPGIRLPHAPLCLPLWLPCPTPASPSRCVFSC
ncbi:hypothetical protein E2C01_037326 [Portunus trituberculatus]|uniref:Uncharacterized protein n=1 Tax=Portunus trituberculatus TaxID=210409 RepID=A0A5B7FGS2_PORTR|nr:hypothetical protein [Portunus trituberculatus]